MSPAARLKKMALYLKYIAFLLEEDAKALEAAAKVKTKKPKSKKKPHGRPHHTKHPAAAGPDLTTSQATSPTTTIEP